MKDFLHKCGINISFRMEIIKKKINQTKPNRAIMVLFIKNHTMSKHSKDTYLLKCNYEWSQARKHSRQARPAAPPVELYPDP